MSSNVTQYQFELLDIAKLLLRKQQITEGFWTVGCGFSMTAALAGPEPSKARPSMIVSVDKLILSKSEEMTPMTVDASKLASESN